MRRADLDTLLIAVYCAACSLFPALAERRRRRWRLQLFTDNELICPRTRESSGVAPAPTTESTTQSGVASTVFHNEPRCAPLRLPLPARLRRRAHVPTVRFQNVRVELEVGFCDP